MLLNSPRWLAPIVLAASLQGAAASDAVTADTVLAEVNGVKITAGHLLLMRGALPQQYQTLPNDALYDGLLQQAISQILLGSTVTDMGKAADLALENEARALRANVAMSRLAEGAVSEDGLQAAYEARFGDVAPAPEYHAAHILVETEEDAAKIVEELEAGADFAALARERSTGPSGPSGGDLGWFGQGTMVAPFEEAVVALEPGAISGPVQTQFGWHVIKLYEIRDQAAPALDEVRADLAGEIQEAAIEAKLTELRGAAKISETGKDAVDLGFLSDPSLLEN
ncbi:MAG: peptidylprolyl isomerase [Rhodobacteraceae bacterium]|nr:peptidylprolyl isomerase [Paracoccaceae bacterium]